MPVPITWSAIASYVYKCTSVNSVTCNSICFNYSFCESIQDRLRDVQKNRDHLPELREGKEPCWRAALHSERASILCRTSRMLWQVPGICSSWFMRPSVSPSLWTSQGSSILQMTASRSGNGRSCHQRLQACADTSNA